MPKASKILTRAREIMAGKPKGESLEQRVDKLEQRVKHLENKLWVCR